MTGARTWSTCTSTTSGRRSIVHSASPRSTRCEGPGIGCGRRSPEMGLPIKVRLTIAFSATMAVLLAVGGTLLYSEVARTLLHTTDNALRAQASLVQAGL